MDVNTKVLVLLSVHELQVWLISKVISWTSQNESVPRMDNCGWKSHRMLKQFIKIRVWTSTSESTWALPLPKEIMFMGLDSRYLLGCHIAIPKFGTCSMTIQSSTISNKTFGNVTLAIITHVDFQMLGRSRLEFWMPFGWQNSCNRHVQMVDYPLMLARSKLALLCWCLLL